MDTFGSRLAVARGDVGRSELAEVCGVGATAVRMWESDNSTPQYANLVTISRHLNVRIDWLVFGLPPMRPSDSIDKGILESVLDSVTSYLRTEGRELPPSDFAAVIAALYNEAAMRPGEDQRAYLRGLIAMATRS